MFEIKFDEYKAPYEAIPLGHQGEKEARCLIWDVSEYIEEFGRGGVQVKVTQPETGDVYMATNVNLVEEEAKWTLTDVDTAKAGTGMCELYYTDQSGNVLAKSHVMRFWILPTQGDAGDTPSPYEDLIDTIAGYASTAQSASNAATASAARAQTSADYATKVVDEKVGDEAYIRATNDAGLQGQINSLMGAVGSPLVAPLASVMSDTDRIYVYTGNESGYTNGNWYYYNGTAWVSGGVYNSTALETDKTLTASDMAADAKITGDRIGAVLDTFKVGKSYGGDMVTFDDGVVGSPLKDLVVNITAVQSGTGDPSPSNVRAISGYTSVTVTRAGKNLLNVTATGSVSAGGMTYTVNDDKTVDVSGTRTGSSYRLIGTFKGVNGVTYTLTGVPDEIADNPGPARLYLSRGNTTIYATHAGATFTYLDSMGTLNIAIRTDSQISGTIRFKPMVRLASVSDSTYEPYTADTYPITIPSSAGTVYGGTLDVLTGTLTVDRATRTFNDILEGYDASVARFYSIAFDDANLPTTATTPDAITSSVLKGSNSPITDQSTDNTIASYQPSKRVFIVCSSYTDVASFKEALGSQTVCYTLAYPVTYQLTPAEVKVLMGTNHVWADAGSIKSLEYRKNDHGEEYALKAFPTATASGSIASFTDGADNVPVKDLVVNVEPNQDLHGQANPYPAGGGKNLLEVLSNTQTISGVTFTVNRDSGGNVVSVTANGTATANIYYQFVPFENSAETLARMVGKSLIASGISGGGTGQYMFRSQYKKNGTNYEVFSIGSGYATLSYPSDAEQISIQLLVYSGATINTTVYPMIRLASDSDATFAPYSNICPISGFTAANVTRTGKNLLTELPRDIGTFSGVTVSVNPMGQFVLNGTATSNNNVRIGSCTLPAGSYVFTGMTTTGSGSTHFLNITPQWNGTGNQTLYSGYYSGTTTEEITFTVRIYFRSGASFTNTIYEPMIRVASNTDATFDPYNGNTYNVSFGSAGTVYGGTLDVTTGMLTVTYGVLNVTSVLYSGASGSASYWGQVLASGAKKIPNSTVGNTKSSYLPTTSQTTMINTEVNAIATNNNGAVTFKIVGMTSKADYDTYLAAHPLTIVYELENPISYQLTQTEVKSLLANNNIFSDTGSVASCEYRADTKLYIEHLTTPDSDMIADSNITSGSYFMVGNNLYLATANIANGGAITPGTNCTATNLAAALNAINS